MRKRIKAALKAFQARQYKKKEQESSPIPVASPEMASHLTTSVTNGRVPVDDHFEFKTTHKVFCEYGVAYDFLLVRADVELNRNWFRIAQVLEPECADGQWVTISRYDRIGKEGTTTRYFWPDKKEAIDAFDRLFKLWTGVHWSSRETVRDSGRVHHTYIPRMYPIPPADAVEKGTIPSRLDKRVQTLAKIIFADSVSYFATFDDAQALYQMTYDTDKLPLGPMSIKTLDHGSTILSQVEKLLERTAAGEDQTKALVNHTSRYYTLIPHIFSRDETMPIINTLALVQQERQLLREVRQTIDSQRCSPRPLSHSDPYQSCKLDRLVGSLALKVLEPVSKGTSEYIKIEDYCVNTRGSSDPTLAVTDVIRVEREGEKESFEECCEDGPDNRWLLWHGSTRDNFAGILGKGLRAKPKPAGDTYGRGIYLANTSLISALYCRNTTGEGTGLLVLCEVQLGDVLLLKEYDHNGDRTATRQGKHSCRGMGKWSPTGSEDAGEALGRPELTGVSMPTGLVRKYNGEGNPKHYDEFVVFNPEQVRIRYVVSIEFGRS